MAAPIRFLFDFLSPYAYLAWTQIHPLAERHGRRVEPVPTLLAAFLNHYGHKGPAEIPPKRVYVFKDVLRTAAVLGVPLAPPPSHPFNPLLGLRVCALPDLAPATRRALVDGLFAATWGGGGGVTDPEAVGRIAAEAGVADAVARALDPDHKARFRRIVEQTVADGAWGVPTMLVDDEVFWGLDSFGHLERFLAGEDPLARIDPSHYMALPSSAQRSS